MIRKDKKKFKDGSIKTQIRASFIQRLPKYMQEALEQKEIAS